jgi:hypothetical protein
MSGVGASRARTCERVIVINLELAAGPGRNSLMQHNKRSYRTQRHATLRKSGTDSPLDVLAHSTPYKEKRKKIKRTFKSYVHTGEEIIYAGVAAVVCKTGFCALGGVVLNPEMRVCHCV